MANQVATNGSPKQRIKQFQQNLIDKIAREIVDGSCQLGEESHLLQNKKTMEYRERLGKIKQTRAKTLESLQQLEEEQEQLKKMLKCDEDSRIRNSFERSQFTEEEKNKIKSILKRQRSEESEKRARHEAIIKDFERKMIESRQKEEMMIQQKRRENRKSHELNLKMVEERRNRRLQILLKGRQRTKQLKNVSYAYIKNEKEDEEIRKLESQEAKRVLLQLKEKRKLDLDSIREHQKKVKEFEKMLYERSKEKLTMAKSNISASLNLYQGGRKIRELLAQQEEEIKQNEKIKEQRRKQFKQRKQSFARYVRENFQPKISKKTERCEFESQSTKLRTLTAEDRNQQGNNYLKAVIDQRRRAMKMQKRQRVASESNSIARSSFYMRTLQADNSTKARHRNSEQQSEASRRRYKIKGLQASEDEKILESIMDKIQVLNSMYC